MQTSDLSTKERSIAVSHNGSQNIMESPVEKNQQGFIFL